MNRNRRLIGSMILAGLVLAVLPTFAAEARKVNVNTADAAQLALLPRVGPSLAQKILDFRKENGPFKSAEDLMLVQGIGEKTYQQLKPYVSTSGETTLKEKVKAGAASKDAPAKEKKPKEGER